MIEEARHAAHLTRRELADRVGVTWATIANIEKGRDRPSIALLDLLERELGTKLADRGVCPCGCGTVTLAGAYAHNHEARVRDRGRVDARRGQLKALLLEGCSQTRAAELLDVSGQTISNDVAAIRDELDELGITNRRNAPQSPRRPLDTVSGLQAARILGCAPSTVARFCDEGALPCTRFGRERRIDARAVVRLALEKGVELWSVREASRCTNEPRYAIENLGRSGRLLVLPGGPRGARMVVPAQLQELLAELERNPDKCPGCGEGLKPGRLWHRDCHIATVRDDGLAAALTLWGDPGYRAAESERRSAEISRQWGEDGSRADRRRVPNLVRCFGCNDLVERNRQKLAKSERFFCTSCKLWNEAHLRAWWAAAKADSDLEALRKTLAIGHEVDAAIRALRPPRFGRHPKPIAINIAVYALFTARKLPDSSICALLRIELGANPEFRIPGVVGEPNDRYVSDRRRAAGIHRPKTPANSISP